ncbi:hypothetical protein ACIBKY_09610 [Nonomuraea sp. NPDC050394]|uniref:hypothetical protein n=1 Tax=Nonomuraea sp. NPDC050394 TaxID=3364363 RepID=UPI0037A9DFCE
MKPLAALAAAVPLVAGCAAGAAGSSSSARSSAHPLGSGTAGGAERSNATASKTPAVKRPKVPAGTTAGYVVFDRTTGKIVVHQNARRKFRSASVSKILIAIDFLETHKSVQAGDARLLRIMLRSSDDGAATSFWNRGGKGAIITRMARKLRLADTTPPPASKPGFWGYVSLSAYDIVKTYRYLLDTADPRVRDLVLGHLRKSTRCGTDGFDQSFGIPGAIPRPWAVKQGWSGFGLTPPVRCANTAAAAEIIPASAGAPVGGGPISVLAAGARGTTVPDYGHPVLHTTGLLGKNDRLIMALLTAHPAAGTWDASVKRINKLAADLYRSVS